MNLKASGHKLFHNSFKLVKMKIVWKKLVETKVYWKNPKRPERHQHILSSTSLTNINKTKLIIAFKIE